MANAPGQGHPINLPELKLWPEAVEGSILLDALSSTIREYVILSDVQADAVALWSVHTHAHNASDVSPKLVLKSAQKRSGKTRLAQVMERLVAHPVLISGIRPAAGRLNYFPASATFPTQFATARLRLKWCASDATSR